MRIILRTMDLPGKYAATYRPRKSPISVLQPKLSLRVQNNPTVLENSRENPVEDENISKLSLTFSDQTELKHDLQNR